MSDAIQSIDDHAIGCSTSGLLTEIKGLDAINSGLEVGQRFIVAAR